MFGSSQRSPAKQQFTHLLVYDFEATCNKQRSLQPVEIIELSCAIVDCKAAAITDSFQAYVQPTEHPQLDPFCIELTGIQQQQMDAAQQLGPVLTQHHAWLQQRGMFEQGVAVTAVTWTSWDLAICLCAECAWRKIQRPDYLCSWVDLKQLFGATYKQRGNLRTCVEAAGLRWQGRQHSGLDDALNTARLAIKLMQQAAMSNISCKILNKHTKEVLPTLIHNGQNYIVTEAGTEFEVKVRLDNHTAQPHKIRLTIDGIDVGFSKIMYGDSRISEATFEGYLQQQANNDGPSLYRAFKFGACKPAEDAATVDHPDEIKAGRIELACDVVVATGYQDTSQPIGKPVVVGDEAARKKLPEGKKWFLAPGLKAEAGSTVASSTKWNYTVYTPVSLLAPIKLRYDTADNLILRKILNPSKPEHRAILRASRDERLARMGQEPDAASSRLAAAGSSRHRVKREGQGAAAAAAAGVKREREDGDAAPRSATAETVDLTAQAPAGPLLVNGRAVGADEAAVCDLCDSDDEPSWQVQKKQAIDLGPEL
ncbi:hypothetical protein OEZ86_012070 [Tetradesmus obliquus]|nr:hypothetical protein OEZ86_012070 [Tetradesmus obliquus]